MSPVPTDTFYAYRRPGARTLLIGYDCHVREGLAANGFALAPFNLEKGRIQTIVADSEEEMPVSELPSGSGNMDLTSKLISRCHPAPRYRWAVNEITQFLKNRGGKVVYARKIDLDTPIDVWKSFENLCTAYPEAFVFLFNTPGSGLWLGASPELLLALRDDSLHTMSLAGTRLCGPEDTSRTWDAKNQEEQRLVTDFITSVLADFRLRPVISPVYTRKAGPVEHLCTDITAKLAARTGDVDSPENESTWLGRLLTALSPTPALCGTDRQAALALISKFEDFDRRFYGGFCGPVAAGDTELRVILRCASVEAGGYPSLYCGGGITALSDPDAEWEETENKALTLLASLQFMP